MNLTQANKIADIVKDLNKYKTLIDTFNVKHTIVSFRVNSLYFASPVFLDKDINEDVLLYTKTLVEEKIKILEEELKNIKYEVESSE